VQLSSWTGMLNLGPVSHTCMINLSQVKFLLIVITKMWWHPKIWEIYTGCLNQLSCALPPLDVACSMLCESVCQQL